MDDIQQQVNEEEIATFYNKVEEIWPSNEPWYKYTKAQIEKFVHKNAFKYHDYVLNAGSGGYDYNLNCKMHHVDIAAEKINQLPLYTVASLEKLPFATNTFDGILCVGSVINYCDAVAAIVEMARVLKHGGSLLLEYENSFAYEYRSKLCYKADAQIIKSVYQGKERKRLLNYILCIRFFIEVHSIVSASRFFHMPTYLRVVIECQSRFFPFFPAFSRNCPDYFLHTSGSSSFRSLSDLGAR